MDDQPVTIAEELATALIVRLMRLGVITDKDVLEMTAGLSEEAQHMANALIIEAMAPQDSDWKADRARARFRVIEGGEE